jgi:hypothetical protein
MMLTRQNRGSTSVCIHRSCGKPQINGKVRKQGYMAHRTIKMDVTGAMSFHAPMAVKFCRNIIFVTTTIAKK